MGAEDYTEASSLAHVRRLLDIIACTSAFTDAEGRDKHEHCGSPRSHKGPGSFRKAVASQLKGRQGEEASTRGRTGEVLEASDGTTSRESSRDGEAEVDGLGGREPGKNVGKGLSRVGLADQSPAEGGEGKLISFKGKQEAMEAMAAAAAATEARDMTGMVPHDSQLGNFYDFLSASHLAPPLQSKRTPKVDESFIEEQFAEVQKTDGCLWWK